LYAAEPVACGKPKYYVLEMLPYPSGQLHMGHVRNYSIGDALARHMWMRGYNVLHPMGWDAFGLPAENAALKNNTPPREWTLGNIAAMKRQMQRLGLGYDWATEVTTCLPDYYRWNQWFFLRMYEKGLVYRKKSKVNWCPECATVLANEQVIDGCCWRHEDTIVEQRDLEQWFLRITAYADELLDDLDKLEGWPEKVRTMQRNWIGRSEGTEVDFFLAEQEAGTGNREQGTGNRELERPAHSRLYYAGGHHLRRHQRATCAAARAGGQFTAADAVLKAQVDELIEQQKKAREAGDLGAIEKHGVPTGRFAAQPLQRRARSHLGGQLHPDGLWHRRHHERAGTRRAGLRVCDEVRHCRFVQVIRLRMPGGEDAALPFHHGRRRAGELRRIRRLDLHGAEKRLQGVAERGGFGEATVTFRLKDWGVSRQRYWGTPIPMIHCERDGLVQVPDEQLPVLLPPQIEITQQGGSPLGACRSLSMSPARSAAVRRGARPTPWTRSSTRAGTSIATPMRRIRTLPFDSARGEVLVPHRPVHRRRGARDSAPDLLALLDQGDARSGADRER
jgi:leucyl-tRNA synthetase